MMMEKYKDVVMNYDVLGMRGEAYHTKPGQAAEVGEAIDR